MLSYSGYNANTFFYISADDHNSYLMITFFIVVHIVYAMEYSP